MYINRFRAIAESKTCHFCGETARYTCDTCGRFLCHSHITHVGRQEVCGLADTEVIREDSSSSYVSHFLYV